jgi:hypothetical protein
VPFWECHRDDGLRMLVDLQQLPGRDLVATLRLNERSARRCSGRELASRPIQVARRGWQLSVSAVCVESKCRGNALYDGHPELLGQIRATIASQRAVAGQTRRAAKRASLEANLAACRADLQRLISENAVLLVRADRRRGSSTPSDTQAASTQDDR